MHSQGEGEVRVESLMRNGGHNANIHQGEAKVSTEPPPPRSTNLTIVRVS